MKRRPRALMIAGVGILAVLVAFVILSETGAFNSDIWERKEPLAHPIPVSGVRDGTITLTDGRAFRPAGVSRDGVSVDDYDQALRVIVAQGVEVIRDFGDGRAFLLAEPRFYNWCGTRNYKGNPWARWAGSYVRCPVSQLLIQSRYAKSDADEPALSAQERWRLEGAERLRGFDESPVLVSHELAALRYEGSQRCFTDYDTMLELTWRPPPPSP